LGSGGRHGGLEIHVAHAFKGAVAAFADERLTAPSKAADKGQRVVPRGVLRRVVENTPGGTAMAPNFLRKGIKQAF
jgi:hypothetical protein